MARIALPANAMAFEVLKVARKAETKGGRGDEKLQKDIERAREVLKELEERAASEGQSIDRQEIEKHGQVVRSLAVKFAKKAIATIGVDESIGVDVRSDVASMVIYVSSEYKHSLAVVFRKAGLNVSTGSNAVEDQITVKETETIGLLEGIQKAEKALDKIATGETLRANTVARRFESAARGGASSRTTGK